MFKPLPHLCLLFAMPLLGCAQHPASIPGTAATFLIPMPASTVSAAPLHLNFSVRKSVPEIIGAEIYLNPPAQSLLTSGDKSYVGAVYFSHPETGAHTQIGAFSVPLPEHFFPPWTQRPRLVLIPLWAPGKLPSEESSPLVIQQAIIRAVDNSAFQ